MDVCLWTNIIILFENKPCQLIYSCDFKIMDRKLGADYKNTLTTFKKNKKFEKRHVLYWVTSLLKNDTVLGMEDANFSSSLLVELSCV